MLFLHECIKQGDGWSCTQSLGRHPADFTLASQIFDVVGVLDEFSGEAHEIPIFLRDDGEVNVATFGSVSFIISLFVHDENSLAEASSWTNYDFDLVVDNLFWVLKFLAIFCGKSADAIPCSGEIIEEKE